MKLLVFVLLPFLAYGHDTECLNADGNPISTKPFRNPNDCYSFYQCSNGHLTSQNCAPGTVFNPVLGVCDHPENVPGCDVNTIVACENKPATASCPSGYYIVVKDGFYGRDDGVTCPHKSIKTTSCAASGSFDKLKKKCNLKGSCEITPTNGVFGDPCYGTYKYVKMNFYCKPAKHLSNWHKKVICEHEKETISCPNGFVISVTSAVYGRNDHNTCPSSHVKTTSCAAAGSRSTIRSNCNGKSSCTVEASNSVFGDPCVGTFKYVRMTYVCRRPSKWTKVTVCEGKSQTVSCPANQVIVVGGGYYGRGDGVTCPSSSIKTTKCFAVGSYKSLRSSCHGKNSCALSASNSVFGDPCVGTYKYVRFFYRCRKTIEVCVGDNGQPISNQPFWKPGDCKNYYQCDNGKLLTRPCAPGTSFNPKIGVCDWPHNVPGCA